jgi:hypothetical protein
VDCTGLQTFRDYYASAFPLCAQSQWGWHSFPPPAGTAVSPDSLRLELYETYGRKVGYATSSKGQEELYDYLRRNPHRINLCSIGLQMADEGRRASIDDILGIEQELDLWTGIIRSSFRVFGFPVHVWTSCHPMIDAISIRVESPLCASAGLGIEVGFPYGSPGISASDWSSDGRHSSDVVEEKPGRFSIRRTMDGTRYFCVMHIPDRVGVRRVGAHVFRLSLGEGMSGVEVVLELSPGIPTGRGFSSTGVERESAEQWGRFWASGGCIELAGSSDPRAFELERRIVLSQYLTAIQCAGSLPP